MSSGNSIPSPISTGSSGSFFEQHVNATWLTLLLARAIPPIFVDSQVRKVSFQTRHMGWQTDDVLIQAENGEGKSRKLAAQVKRKLTISSADDECRKTFLAFWTDFSQSYFDRSTDRVCLIVLRGTNVLLEHLGSLIECARASTSKEDFNHRLSKEGFLNAKAKMHAQEIRKGLEVEKITVSEDEFWKFLQCLAVVSFDLNTVTRQTEALMKSLLAQTANGPDKLGTATSSWDSLLNLVSSAMPGAQEYARESLPEDILKRHEPISNSDYLALQALKDHSKPVVNGIRNTINGTVKLERGALVNECLESLQNSRVLVLSGPAGGGKSGIAKDLVERLSDQHFVFSFRAEEFSKVHLDDTLRSSGLQISSERLSAVLGAQPRKVILIESVERLLEASVRDSFSDLLRLAERDGSWTVILTCRAYSLDLVVASFLGQMSLRHSVVSVPELSDEELATVEKAIPQLKIPLSDKRLKKPLRNPYILDKAARMNWSAGDSLPKDEREFRRRFWKEIVRQEDQAEQGMPSRREQTLEQVALRRARALSLYAKCDDLDQGALGKLHERDLIVFSESTKTLSAPAHDLLEDWTLLNWIEIRFIQLEKDAKKLSEEIGTFPALRRSYRLWLSEATDLEPENIDSFVHSVIGDASIPAHFKDDTIVSILRSPSGGKFLVRNRASLVANKSLQLKRVVHLLKVACRSMPDWLASVGYLQSSVMVPVGSAWPNALNLVYEQIDDFLPQDGPLVLGLIEDWSNLVTSNAPYPEGFETVSRIALRLLESMNGYRQHDARKTIFKVICKVPTGDKDGFVKLLQNNKSDTNRVLEEFTSFVLEGCEASFVAKDLPDELIEATKKHLYLVDEEHDPYDRHHRMDIDDFFGLQQHREYFPPSAIRGPFFPLLQNHFKKTVEFILEFANRATDHYTKPNGHDRLEPAWEVEVILPDGSKVKQWHNPRLWQLFRGSSVGPNVLMCALMALERWMLSAAKLKVPSLDSWLVYLIRKSNNSSISAVVASVTVAYPGQCKGALKCLLSCRDYVDIDQRMSVIDRGISSIQAMLPSVNATAQIYESERKESDQLPHRRKNIGVTAFEMQLTDARDEIQAIIDNHYQQLPKPDQQDEADKLWRLALHRIDMRKYDPRVATRKEIDPTNVVNELGEDKSNEPAGILFEPKEPDEDIKTIIDRSKPKIDKDQQMLGMFNWAWSCFTGENNGDPKQWAEYLKKAMEQTPSTGDSPWVHSPAIIAAVCVRDHWKELEPSQREWCLNILSQVVARDRDSSNLQTRISKYAMAPDRPAAVAVATIIAAEPNGKYRECAIGILADSLFHACDEVTRYAAAGIGNRLWKENEEIVIKSASAICLASVELDKKFEEISKMPYGERGNTDGVRIGIDAVVRQKWLSNEIDAKVLDEIDFGKPYSGEALKLLLHIFEGAPNSETSKKFFGRVIEQVCKWWAGKDDKESRTPFELIQVCLAGISNFAIKMDPNDAVSLCQPIFALVQTKQREVGEFVSDLISAVDKNNSGRATFWRLWEEFANRLSKVSWLKHLDSEHFSSGEILRAIFLGASWKKGAKSWEPQRGYEDRIIGLFETLPAFSSVFDRIAVYFYNVGDTTLPDAFVPVAKKIKSAPGKLNGGNTIFYFEQVLQRHVYGTPHKLKETSVLRDSVITILDELVEQGSSAAFKMRDDFVTPKKE